MALTSRTNWTKMNGSGSMPNTACCGKRELEEIEIVMHNAFAKVVNRLFSKDNASDSMDIGTG